MPSLSSNVPATASASCVKSGASRLSVVPLAPPDPILSTAVAFREDGRKEKVNLGVGAYRDESGKSYIFKTVRSALESLISSPDFNLEYLPIDGLPELKRNSQKLAFGANFGKLNNLVSTQALSGTGALRVAAEFLRRFVFPDREGVTVYLSNPTWSNHHNIFRHAHFKVQEYTYWDAKLRGINFEGMKADLEMAEDNSIVVLHACAHNPTGADLSLDQWKELLALCSRKNHFPLFDMAYQGFASGSLEKDAQALRLFADAVPEMLLAQSFAKNLGLYGERIGMLHVMCRDERDKEPVLSQLKATVRGLYSSPPGMGAKILAHVLEDPKRVSAWAQELAQVSGRIQRVRKALLDKLVELKTPGDWTHINKQIGMFSYTGLTAAQCEYLTKEKGIYLLKSGRISLAGLNDGNLDYVAKSIDQAVRSA